VLAILLGLAVFAASTNWAQGQAQPKPQDQPGIKTEVGKSVVVDRTPVEYPEAAIENNVQGTVVVEVTLDKTGAVDDARAVSGPQALRKAALQSVLDWHFSPESGGNKRRVSISFQTPPESTLGKLLRDDQALEINQDIERLEKQLEDSRVTEDLEKQLEDARKRYSEYYPEIQRLKRQLERAQQDLVSHGIAAADQEYRAAQLQGTTEFIRQELEERRRKRQQAIEAQSKAKAFFNCKRDGVDGGLNCTSEVTQDGQQIEQMKAEFDALRAQMEQLRARSEVAQDGQPIERMKAEFASLRAQMEELKARLEAVSAQIAEQKRQQK
jgi:TonB family protein